MGSNEQDNDTGKTVNERLHAAGLMEAFFRAANKKDRDEMISILESIDLDRTQAEATADSIINNPAFTD
jgi:hypothetical protein